MRDEMTTATSARRERKPRSHSRTPDERGYNTVEVAAEKLSMSPEALRARCRRSAVKEGKTVLAHLGAGIVAYKLGRHWRVRFPGP